MSLEGRPEVVPPPAERDCIIHIGDAVPVEGRDVEHVAGFEQGLLKWSVAIERITLDVGVSAIAVLSFGD